MQRKKDHIDLAFKSQVGVADLDTRFDYEPLMQPHPDEKDLSTEFLGKNLNAPIWISSMTGGTGLAGKINTNLAMLCREFGLGMGLGSCRIILEDNTHLEDFDKRDLIGPDLPFYANLGIAQLEQCIEDGKTDLVVGLVERLRADGLIIHVNPLQEWLQPEGDHLKKPAIDTITGFLEMVDIKVIVKEVGQGFGPESLKALMHLPLAAIEFAAFGGTNFAKVELQRSSSVEQELYGPFANIGHDALQMVEIINEIIEENENIKCKNVIVSGGIKSFLDGFYFINKVNLKAIYGQASSFLRYAMESYEDLKDFTELQIKGLKLAKSFLKVKT